MTLPIALFLLAVVVPVFFGKIRSAPGWLLLQGLALGWAGLLQHPQPPVHAAATLVEVIVLRALVAPGLLRRAFRAGAEPHLDLMPSNLFTWAVAVALIVLAYEFGAAAADARHALTLGAVAATVAVALLLLATNASPLAQLTAVLYVENAIGLFELLRPEPWPLPVHLALGLIYLGTVGVGSWLIGAPPASEALSAEEGSA